jgi:hypothetical protein
MERSTTGGFVYAILFFLGNAGDTAKTAWTLDRLDLPWLTGGKAVLGAYVASLRRIGRSA